MRKNGKLLAALLCALLLCALCLPALAEEVDYIYYTKDDKTNEITRHDGKRTDATVLTGVETELRTGWYVAEGDITFNDRRPYVSGDVHLILKDGCKLTASLGITVNEGTAEDGKANSLSIYAQREGEGMGALTASGQGYYGAGIGGAEGSSSGLITIHGGAVTATTSRSGAGIGGGSLGSGTVTIHGGMVTATANGDSAGIGGGDSGSGTVEISGGTVTATANRAGAGIGGGRCVNGRGGNGEVTIEGGTVMATASGLGAAIGNGYDSSNGSVTVKGGRVSAVHTTQSKRSIGGSNCAVSLGWKDADDYVYAAGYTGSVTLAKDFLIAGTTTMLQAGPVEDLSEIAGQILLPSRNRTVRCIGYEWDEGEKRLKRKIHEVPNPKPLTGTETTLTGGTTAETAVWYRVSGPVTLSTRPEVRGHVNLILMDGCDLRAEHGITVNEGNFLSIFAQSEGVNMGALTVPGQGSNAGIGGTSRNSSGLITIHGGKIEAASDFEGAGIGGGQSGAGTVTIYGGTVTATAYDGAGIGGGIIGSGEVKIYGGTVTAAANFGAGIGGGNHGSGTVEISGGTVTATATAYEGAGIGGGQSGTGTVTIHGGTVTATASGNGAAIGNGNGGDGGEVTITGGRVSAVHTTKPGLSIGGDLGKCTVSLGLTQKNDSVYATGYAAKDNMVTLTAALQDAGTGEKFPAKGDASPEVPASIAADKLTRKLLIPDTEEAARQYAWSGAAFRLPWSLSEIGKGAFQNIRAATVLVPPGVKRIGADAFRGSGVKRIKFENGNPEAFDASAFADCPFVIVYTPPKGSVYDALKDVLNVYLMPVK